MQNQSNNENKNERVAIYIDGSNFYFKLKSSGFDIPNTNKFDYRGFSNWLAAEREIISCRYYIGIVKSKDGNSKGQYLRAEQQKLFSHLESPKQNFIIKRGNLIKNDGKYHEKGVDVKIAVDLIVGAYDDIYDTAILVSSDTDLIPAIQKVRHLGKKIQYVGFSHQPSFGLLKYANFSKLLLKDDLESFIFKD